MEEEEEEEEEEWRNGGMKEKCRHFLANQRKIKMYEKLPYKNQKDDQDGSACL